MKWFPRLSTTRLEIDLPLIFSTTKLYAKTIAGKQFFTKEIKKLFEEEGERLPVQQGFFLLSTTPLSILSFNDETVRPSSQRDDFHPYLQ